MMYAEYQGILQTIRNKIRTGLWPPPAEPCHYVSRVKIAFKSCLPPHPHPFLLQYKTEYKTHVLFENSDHTSKMPCVTETSIFAYYAIIFHFMNRHNINGNKIFL